VLMPPYNLISVGVISHSYAYHVLIYNISYHGSDDNVCKGDRPSQ